MNYALIIAVPIAWLIFAVHPRVGLPIGLAVYLGLVGWIGWSAVRHRREGWVSGLLLAVMLATIPLWVMGAIWLYSSLCFIA